MIKLDALNRLSRLVKEKTDGKIDIDGFYMFTKNYFTNLDFKYGARICKCNFVSMTDKGCIVVSCEFIEGEYLKGDTVQITSFDFGEYKTVEKALREVSEYSGIEEMDLLWLSLNKATGDYLHLSLKKSAMQN